MNYKEIINLLEEDEADFIFSALKIENHNKHSTSRLRFWFDHLKDNHQKIDGDIFEFGVFKGASLISIAILAKRLGSSKKIYGFDSFSGFPSYSEKDDLNKFEDMNLSKSTKKRIEVLQKIRSSSVDLDPSNISDAGDFSNTSFAGLQKKIEDLELDNIIIIEGDFAKTVPDFFKNYDGCLFSANIDCDLYDGYKTVLPQIEGPLSKNGYVHLDEYYSLKFPGAKIATDEFLENSQLTLLSQPSVKPHEFERWYLTKI